MGLWCLLLQKDEKPQMIYLLSKFTVNMAGVYVCDTAFKSLTHQTSVHHGRLLFLVCADPLAPSESHTSVRAPSGGVGSVPAARPALSCGLASWPRSRRGNVLGNPGHSSGTALLPPALSRVVRGTGQLRPGSENFKRPSWPVPCLQGGCLQINS